jgi:hypothetical protein
MTKELILSNLRLLRSAVEAQPEKLFDLAQFKQEEPCGTLFCTAGLAATMPEFQKQGIRLVGEVSPYNNSTYWRVQINGEELWDGDEDGGPADALFGECSADNCFSERWGSEYDEAILGDWEHAEDNITDKQLALSRLDAQIEFVEAQ